MGLCCVVGKTLSTLLQALKLLTPLIRKLGPNANPGKLKELPVKGALMWAFYAGFHHLLLAYLHAPCSCTKLPAQLSESR